MKAKVYSYLLLAVLLIAIWLVSRPKKPVAQGGKVSHVETREDKVRNRGFKRNVSALKYSVHARCRMECRHITQGEVQDIMQHGTINYRKSDLNDRPCPTYALEGFTRQDNQHVRIVFAQCDRDTKVVTCIDLDRDFACNCK